MNSEHKITILGHRRRAITCVTCVLFTCLAFGVETDQVSRAEAVVCIYERDIAWLMDVVDGNVVCVDVSADVLHGRSGSNADRVDAMKRGLAIRIAALEALGKLRATKAADCVIRNLRLGDPVIYPEWPDIYDTERDLPGVQAMICIGIPCVVALLKQDSPYLGKPYSEHRAAVGLYAFALQGILGMQLAAVLVEDELQRTTNAVRKENLERILRYVTSAKESTVQAAREDWFRRWGQSGSPRNRRSESVAPNGSP